MLPNGHNFLFKVPGTTDLYVIGTRVFENAKLISDGILVAIYLVIAELGVRVALKLMLSILTTDLSFGFRLLMAWWP